MQLTVKNHFKYLAEIRQQADLSGPPLFSQDVTRDMGELVEESFISGILSDQVTPDLERLHCQVTPLFRDEPVVHRMQLELTVEANGSQVRHVKRFSRGRWMRTAQAALAELYEDNIVARTELVFSMLLAMRCQDEQPIHTPRLEAPAIVEQELDALGIRDLRPGSWCPDRPVLVNERLVSDAVRRCEEAGANETGGAILGKIVRLPEPLPGARTRVVTVLTTLVEDLRHEGAPLQFYFSPEALAEAANMAELRGMGETVQTVFHSHGWSPKCSGCEQNGKCPLSLAVPSLKDYQVLESLLSSKATLMPIAGRRAGMQKEHPILEISAWRGGEMQPIKYRRYAD